METAPKIYLWIRVILFIYRTVSLKGRKCVLDVTFTKMA